MQNNEENWENKNWEEKINMKKIDAKNRIRKKRKKTKIFSLYDCGNYNSWRMIQQEENQSQSTQSGMGEKKPVHVFAFGKDFGSGIK